MIIKTINNKFIRIYSLDQAIIICKVAQDLNVKINLLSSLYAAQIIGSPIFKTISNKLEKLYPKNVNAIWLDTGSEEAAVLQAIEYNIKYIIFNGKYSSMQKLQNIAKQKNITIKSRPKDKQILDCVKYQNNFHNIVSDFLS